MQRGSDFVKYANAEKALVLLIQETMLQDHEAAAVARNLKDWHFYHQTGRLTANRATGGVAVLVHKTIPSARIGSYADDNGEWLSVVIPDMIFTPAYRRNNRIIQQLQSWHEKLNEHWATLPQPNWLLGGDFNATPQEDILQVWSAHHGAQILHPGTPTDPKAHAGNPLAALTGACKRDSLCHHIASKKSLLTIKFCAMTFCVLPCRRPSTGASVQLPFILCLSTSPAKIGSTF